MSSQSFADCEEQRLADNSERFHQHPSQPSSCEVYEEFYGRRCPCESYDQGRRNESKETTD